MTNDSFADDQYLLDGTVQHSCRTWSNTAAADHYTHHEASHNLELTPGSKQMYIRLSQAKVSCPLPPTAEGTINSPL